MKEDRRMDDQRREEVGREEGRTKERKEGVWFVECCQRVPRQSSPWLLSAFLCLGEKKVPSEAPVTQDYSLRDISRVIRNTESLLYVSWVAIFLYIYKYRIKYE